MAEHRHVTQVTPVLGAVVIAAALVVVWLLAPEITLVALLLLGVAAEVILYGVLYLVERRHHW